MIGRRERRQETIKKIAIGSTLAAAAGYIAGVMTAPKSGKQTRGDLKAKAGITAMKAEKDLKKLQAELSRFIDEAKGNSEKLSVKARSEIDDMVEKAKDTKEKAREMISAVREGEADDKDLQNAVNEAREAIDHLRNYIKK
ncbi:MAG: hypothetical protein JWO35_294 [Candidatus Saccharibacteria bacterium]|nr:hypothetical protein [Candidatus Saccharibacteria bacterium]